MNVGLSQEPTKRMALVVEARAMLEVDVVGIVFWVYLERRRNTGT